MNFRKFFSVLSALAGFWLTGLFQPCHCYPLFIYRPDLFNLPLMQTDRIAVHGEFFGQLQAPSSFPSYNDNSGKTDRWTFGFQNKIFPTPGTEFLAQLVTHDDGGRRTKFDWHFSLRHSLMDNLVLILGHDSNHDSDRQSFRRGKPYFLNRNYIGFGLPFKTGHIYIEPFTWFFHHSNQLGYLDFSGDKTVQEYGIRIGTWLERGVGISFQLFAQSSALFSGWDAYTADLIIRYRPINSFELSLGGSVWADIGTSPLGNSQRYTKIAWGIAIPF